MTNKKLPDFASVYAALQQGVPESKFFVHDMGCDGLKGAAGGMADIIYLRGKDQRIIDGDHKAAKMSSADDARLVGETERRYVELLSVLLEAAGGKNGSDWSGPHIQPGEHDNEGL